MLTEQAQKVLDRLNGKGGESYDGEGRHGWRNPVREDTPLLLYSLVLAERPQRVLELGTAYGKSGLYLASALPEGGKLYTVEFFAPVAKEAQENFDEAGLPVTVCTGDVLDVIPNLVMTEAGQFNVVFLDAEKKTYLTHLQALASAGLLAEDCLIIADNVIDRAEEMEDFLQFMSNQESVILNTECGLLVGRLA